MSVELHIARQWVAKARNDLLNADNNLCAAIVPSDDDAREARQCAENVLNWLNKESPELV